MKVLWKTSEMPEDLRGSVLAIGNFDGVHRGHLSVLNTARTIAAKNNVPFGALTFEPHPRFYFKPDAPHFNLTCFPLKEMLMATLGLDVLAVAAFDKSLASMTAREFAGKFLVENLRAGHVVTGRNFHFGKGREGDIATLKMLGKELGFEVTSVDQVTSDHGETFSSTAVRECLQQGKPDEAAKILGHWWQVLGPVVEGDKRGRTIGFPTANILLSDNETPKFGVYAVRARIFNDQMGPVMSGVANLGLRPTFERNHTVLEVNLFDFAGDLYGKTLLVELISFIRPEQKFDGLDALKAQIAKDAEAARVILAIMKKQGDPMEAYPIGKYFAS